MAATVLRDAFVSVNGVDLSDHLRSVTLEYAADLQETTAMGDDFRTRLGGLKDWNMSLEFNQDFAGGSVDATLFAIVGNSVPVILRPSSGARATTNPEWRGNAILESYTPLGNAVGEVAIAPVTLQGNGTLARDTA